MIEIRAVGPLGRGIGGTAWKNLFPPVSYLNSPVILVPKILIYFIFVLQSMGIHCILYNLKFEQRMSRDEGPSIPGQKNASHFILLAFGFGSYVNKLQDAIDDYGNPFAQYSGWFQNFIILTV